MRSRTLCQDGVVRETASTGQKAESSASNSTDIDGN